MALNNTLLGVLAIFPTRYLLLSAPVVNQYLQERYRLNDPTCQLLIHNVLL